MAETPTRTDARPIKDVATTRERIGSSGVVAVMRADDAAHFPRVARQLVELGLTALEITLTTRGALDALRAIREDKPDEVVVGAGTVLNERQAAACIEAGADFLVTPGLVPELVRLARAGSTPVYPGALTPSEFIAATQLGADLIKLFPADLFGPKYLQHLRGPLPDIEIMPTGGIQIDDIPAWLRAGAVTVGLGGPLLGDVLDGGSTDALRRRATAALEAVRTHRGAS
jgi:2-dehydro-3-deoxyphosphogluconate aldolase/(4S)-4-hydroxy-2-oxoglutarate aldolase